MAPERGEHVVEKPDARLHVRFARAVKADGQVDVGFLRGARDMRNAFAHCCSPFSRRVRIDSGQIALRPQGVRAGGVTSPRRPSAPASARLKFWAVLQVLGSIFAMSSGFWVVWTLRFTVAAIKPQVNFAP